jgi:hypothetical protein
MKIGRHGKVLSLALAVSCLPSCNRDGPADEPRPVAVVRAALESGACTYRWNGVPVSRQALLQNSVDLLMGAMNRQSEELNRLAEKGVFPEYDGPLHVDFRLEAAPGLPFACFGPALRIAQLAGFSEAVLRVAGERLPDQTLFFEYREARPSPRFAAIVRIEAGNRMSWNGAPVDLNGVRERVNATDRQIPDDVALAPADDADFLSFHEAVRVVGKAKIMPTLQGCAAPSRPPGDTQPC